MPALSLRLATWNVLHRIHALNWNEAPVAAFPDEQVRVERIASKVAAWVAADVDVVCLQEVSGDQLAALRRAVAPSTAIFAHTYPRLPALRGGGRCELDDAHEHLVTIVKAAGAREVEARTFATDPGKGLLAVEVAGTVVVNTHVSFGERRAEQLAVLANVARSSAYGTIVLGDFNAAADVVGPAFGQSATITDLSGQGPTRVATDAHQGLVIDHVVALDRRLNGATVLPSDGLSDHNPVVAVVAGA